MKIGVVGDSHRNIEYLRMAAQLLKDEGVKEIIHLGDEYDDAEVLGEFGVNVTRVPGVFDSHYRDPRVANRLIRDIGGWRVLLTHSPRSHENDLPQDLKPEDAVAMGEVNVVLYAHTHLPAIEEKGGVLLVNPGHLKTEDRKGAPASFAVLDFEAGRVKVKIVDLIKRETIRSYEFKGK